MAPGGGENNVAKRRPRELFINLLGWLRDRVVHMTYTERGEELHLISGPDQVPA